MSATGFVSRLHTNIAKERKKRLQGMRIARDVFSFRLFHGGTL